MSAVEPIRTTPVTVRDRLTATLFLAGLFHLIVILGITFAPRPAGQGPVQTLEVLLTPNTLPESTANERASYLAERTQQGAGDRATARTRQPRAGEGPEDIPGDAHGGSEQLFAEPARGGDGRILSTRAPGAHWTAAEEPEEVSLPALPREVLAGVLSPFAGSDDAEELALKGATRRELLVTPSTRQSEVSAYLDAWKRRIEQIGTLHFPNEARRRHLSGNPVIEVALAASGGLIHARVQRSSSHAELDQAALEILKLAAPFEPFPVELARRHDMLRFAYEWQFVGGRLAGSAVEVPVPD